MRFDRRVEFFGRNKTEKDQRVTHELLKGLAGVPTAPGGYAIVQEGSAVIPGFACFRVPMRAANTGRAIMRQPWVEEITEDEFREALAAGSEAATITALQEALAEAAEDHCEVIGRIGEALGLGETATVAEIVAAAENTEAQKGKEEAGGAERIARACHEANRAYCAMIGDGSQVGWDEAEDWQRESAIAGVQLALGDAEVTPEKQHEAWMAQKLEQGWVYGEEKDAEKKTHPCLVSYAELPEAQRVKDIIFQAVARGMAGVQAQEKANVEHPTSNVEDRTAEAEETAEAGSDQSAVISDQKAEETAESTKSEARSTKAEKAEKAKKRQ